MKRLVLKPADFPCSFEECPPGLFLHGETVCMKTEYGNDEGYNIAGERYHGHGEKVIPLVAIWEEE